MAEFDAVAKWVAKVELTVVAARRGMARAAGDAGKKAALDAAAGSLGGDRKFSGMPRKGGLSAGYDVNGDSSVTINFRGPWRLAEEGRKKSGTIRPKRRKAVRTPQGLRAVSHYGKSRGLHTYSDAVKKASTAVPKAAHDALVRSIGSAF